MLSVQICCSTREILMQESRAEKSSREGRGAVAGTQPDTALGVYGISVAAELVGTGVQNLRAYEARGLLEPTRTEGGTRRYSANDLDRLRRIGRAAQRRTQPRRHRHGPGPAGREQPATRRGETAPSKNKNRSITPGSQSSQVPLEQLTPGDPIDHSCRPTSKAPGRRSAAARRSPSARPAERPGPPSRDDGLRLGLRHEANPGLGRPPRASRRRSPPTGAWTGSRRSRSSPSCRRWAQKANRAGVQGRWTAPYTYCT